MRALIVGYGSIGARHADILRSIGLDVSLVSKQKVSQFPCWTSLESAFTEGAPDYVVIASTTSLHHSQMVELAALGFRGKLLVEKPLFIEPLPLPANNFAGIWVAYNLRFHPLLQKVQLLLQQENIVSVHAYVGQYLPQWRPTRDYRTSYSAKRAEGGGVLRDLSHEFDYLTWLLGKWRRIVSMGGHYSNLEIDSDDAFSVMMETERCTLVTLQMNCLDRISQRQVTVITDSHTFYLDLLNGILRIDDIQESFSVERDYTYRAMHGEILTGHSNNVCSAEKGLEILGLINAAELSARSKVWIAQ